MARVNLLTIHYGKCYGAVMQTYATCKLLEQAGHTVKVINLVNPCQKGKWKTMQYWKDCIREFQFWRFKKLYFSKLTSKAYAIKDIVLPPSDVTVVGSDQVWNRDITGCFGYAFYLDFVNGQKKVAISSSFGKEEWDESFEYTTKVKELLSQFSSVSVRETTGVEIAKGIMGLNAIRLVDPTLGYGHFDDLVLNTKPFHQVFSFLLLNDRKALDLVDHVSKELRLPLFKHCSVSCRLRNGPRHWLTRIKNSDFVITDSFHGLALSLIFKKQFFILCASEKKFTRLRSLLCLLSLEERYIESIEDFENRKDSLLVPIDYSQVNIVLRKEQERYQKFIRESI